MKRMSLKQFVFIIPLLVFLGVFSAYPIVTSVLYSFFNYRTNDQSYNGFYMDEKLNVDLFLEDCKYVNYFLNTDIAVVNFAGQPVIEEEDQEKMTALIEKVSEKMAEYEDETGVREFQSGEKEELESFIAEIEEETTAFYNDEKYADVTFYNKENMVTMIENMKSAIISSNYLGAENYVSLLNDSRFWKALAHTLVFTVITVALEFCIGMCLALIMNKAMRGIGLVRTIALVPWAIPTAVSALMWSYMYDGSYGIISKILADIHIIKSSTDMLLTATGAMGSAIFADVWKTSPYMALLLLAGLQTIDRGLYESAAIDGSTPVHTFFKITLPLMKPSIMVALLFRTLDAFRVYDLISILTSGGPGNGTETLSVYAYKLMFGQSNYGYGSTVVIGMFVFVALIAFLYIKVLGAEVFSSD